MSCFARPVCLQDKLSGDGGDGFVQVNATTWRHLTAAEKLESFELHSPDNLGVS